MKNTRILLTYTSGNQDKTDKEFVVKGELNSEQVERIQGGLIDGEFIIAHEVGLPTPSENFYGFNDYPSKEYDHIFTRLPEFMHDEVDIESMITDEVACTNVTIEELSHKILNAEWDLDAEIARIGLDYSVSENVDEDEINNEGEDFNTLLKIGYFNTEGKRIIKDVIFEGELDDEDIKSIFESSRKGIILACMTGLESPSDSISDDDLFPDPYVDNPFTVLVDFYEKNSDDLQFKDIFCEAPIHVIPKISHFYTELDSNSDLTAKEFVFAIERMEEEIQNHYDWEDEWARMEEQHSKGPDAEKIRMEKINAKHHDLIEAQRIKQDVLDSNAKELSRREFDDDDLVF